MNKPDWNEAPAAPRDGLEVYWAGAWYCNLNDEYALLHDGVWILSTDHPSKIAESSNYQTKQAIEVKVGQEWASPEPHGWLVAAIFGDKILLCRNDGNSVASVKSQAVSHEWLTAGTWKLISEPEPVFTEAQIRQAVSENHCRAMLTEDIMASLLAS